MRKLRFSGASYREWCSDFQPCRVFLLDSNFESKRNLQQDGFVNSRWGHDLNGTSKATKIAKLLLVFFAVLFAAILIHPEWDLPEVHDVKITSTRHQSQCPANRPIQQVAVALAHLAIPHTSALDQTHNFLFELPSFSPETLPSVLRV